MKGTRLYIRGARQWRSGLGFEDGAAPNDSKLAAVKESVLVL